jgi:hypothetical protein
MGRTTAATTAATATTPMIPMSEKPLSRIEVPPYSSRQANIPDQSSGFFIIAVSATKRVDSRVQE